MNLMPDDECFEIIETSLEHPNLEVLQIADRPNKAPEDEEEVKPKKGKKAAPPPVNA